jgi:predicted amidohydrolase
MKLLNDTVACPKPKACGPAMRRSLIKAVLAVAVVLLVTGSHAENPKPAAPKLRIALVQMALQPTLAENRERIVRGIGDAAARGARVAVFPERALTGAGGERTEAVEAAVQVIRRTAREKNVYVVSGAHTFLPSVKKNANWMFAIGPDGEELLRYEKLYDNHRAKMPGVFLIDGVPCSTAICADRWLRGVVELPIQQGSQICFELSNNYACEWVEPYGWYWNAPLARRNNVWSILCNSGNELSGQSSPGEHLKHGHSAIMAPDGRVVASTSSDSEEIVIAEVDPGQASRAMTVARGTHPTLAPFWEAGIRLQRGETISAPAFEPLRSPAVDITLAAAPIVNDVERMEAAIAEARDRGVDFVAFPAQAISEGALERLQAAARKSHVAVAVGARHASPEGVFNSAFVFGPEGNLLTRYDQLSAEKPLLAGRDARAMWFCVKGVPAVITVEQDALWTELAELPAVAGAQIHIHLDRATDDSTAGRQARLQTWVTCASFLTFSATVSDRDAMLWDDLHSREESRAEVKGTPRPDAGQVEVLSPFSANLIERAEAGKVIVAKRRVLVTNPHHPYRTANMNPQMKPWYELGASLIVPLK